MATFNSQNLGNSLTINEYPQLAFGGDAPRDGKLAKHFENVKETLSGVLEMMGMSESVASPFYQHEEQEESKNNIRIGAIITAATGVNTTAIVEVHADSMIATQLVGTNPAILYLARVNKDDRLILKDGQEVNVEFVDKTTDLDNWRLTLKPTKSTNTLVGKFTAGEFLINKGNNLAETNVRSGNFSLGWDVFSGGFISKSKSTVFTENSILARAPWVSQDGKIIYSGTVDIQTELMKECSMELLTAKLGNNIFQPTGLGYDAPAHGFDGVFELATKRGNPVNVSTFGLIDHMEVDKQSALYFTSKRLPKGAPIMSLMSTKRFLARSDAYRNYQMNSGIDLTKLKQAMAPNSMFSNLTAEEVAVQMNVQTVTRGNYTFAAKALADLDDSRGLATTGYSFQNLMLNVPLFMFTNKTRGVDGVDSENSSPIFTIMHQKNGKFDNRMKTFVKDGTGWSGNASNSVANSDITTNFKSNGEVNEVLEVTHKKTFGLKGVRVDCVEIHTAGN